TRTRRARTTSAGSAVRPRAPARPARPAPSFKRPPGRTTSWSTCNTPNPSPMGIRPELVAISGRVFAFAWGCGVAPTSIGEPHAHARDRLAVQLAHSGFGHTQHRADFLEVEFFLVIKGDHQLLALRQRIDRGLDPFAMFLAEQPGDGRLRAFGVVFRLAVFLDHFLERQQIATVGVSEQLLVLGEADTHLGSDFIFLGWATV